MSASWVWILCDAQGVSMAELSTASGRSITYKRNTYSEATFTVSHEDESASLLLGALANTGVPTLRCYRRAEGDRRGALRFAGFLAAIQETAEEATTLTAVFRSPFARLYGNGNDFGRFLSAQGTYTAMDAGAIARAMIDAANMAGATRLVPGVISTTKARDRTYPVGTNAGDAIFNLTNVLDGFDFYEEFIDSSVAQPALPTIANPSFDVDLSGWALTGTAGISLVRDTAVFDSTPASAKITLNTAIDAAQLETGFTGTFLRGRVYSLATRMKIPGANITIGFGEAGVSENTGFFNSTTGFETKTVAWTPAQDSTSATLRFIVNSLAASPCYVDSVTLTDLTSTSDATFNVVASQGVDNATARFEYGPSTLANVRSVQRETEPPANDILVIGGNGLTATYSDATSITRYGVWQCKAEYSDVTEQATLNDKARALVRPYPVRTVSFAPDAALAPKPWDDYELGDTVRFLARRGALAENTSLRINAFTVVISDDGIESDEIPDPTTPEQDNMIRASLTAEIVTPPAVA